jgi:hypothetical protein
MYATLCCDGVLGRTPEGASTPASRIHLASTPSIVQHSSAASRSDQIAPFRSCSQASVARRPPPRSLKSCWQDTRARSHSGGEVGELSSRPDKSLGYLGDGVSDDIITMLSRFPELSVVARNSSFVYKGKPVDIRQVGRDLNVDYALEGSVRKEADQIRIVAQLIDTQTGKHVWRSATTRLEPTHRFYKMR